MKTDRHIIDKVFLEIDVASETEAYWLKDHISSFLNDKVFPGLEKLFNKLSDAESISRFGRIELEIDLDNLDQLESLRFQLEKQLQQKIAFNAVEKRYPVNGEQRFQNGVLHSPRTNGLSTTQNAQEIFLFFLQNAYLPWYGKKSDIDKVIAEDEWIGWLKQNDFVRVLKQLLLSDRNSLYRFVMQVPLSNIVVWIGDAKKLDKHQLETLGKFLSDIDINVRSQLISVLVKISVGYKKSEWKPELIEFLVSHALKIRDSAKSENNYLQQIAKQLQNISHHTVFEFTQNDSDKVLGMLKKQSRDQTAEKGVTQQKRGKIENDPTIISDVLSFTNEKEPLFFEKDVGEIAVQNAGQVLFHPFLKTLFQHFQWLDEAGKIKTDQRFKAVQALHYCAAGNDQFFEGDLVLEKFLCDVPLKTTLPASSLLDEAIKNEADNMLRELIKNWPALKNTSPDGLRELFVNRSGKLIQKDRNFKLIVERKTQDILLEKLQWSISIIKLPWKKELIFVEW